MRRYHIRGQEEVSKGVTDFYRKLYSHEDVNTEDDGFYENCPKLSMHSKEYMKKELTEEELLTALKTCADSAPGSDGIPYSVYKKLWNITGPYIHKAWLFSCATGTLPPSHKESIITLLPKEGKDIKDIKNWRPITLSN